MSIEVRRFGVGYRRPGGPPGTVGIEAQVLESRASGFVAELAFGREARITPHSNPNTTLFIVIEGGGWVGVGDERTRVAAGEAAVWPANVIHAAWTDGVPMRAIVVELPEDPKQLAASEIEGEETPKARGVSRGEGSLAPRARRRGEGAAEGEPD